MAGRIAEEMFLDQRNASESDLHGTPAATQGRSWRRRRDKAGPRAGLNERRAGRRSRQKTGEQRAAPATKRNSGAERSTPRVPKTSNALEQPRTNLRRPGKAPAENLRRGGREVQEAPKRDTDNRKQHGD
jgi:hypothetical protein